MTRDGIIPVWKPENVTSYDVVSRIRRRIKQKKVGHTGTLDPAAVGVLPVCIGKATRVAEYVQQLPKTYEGTLTLGIGTDTQDQTGTVTERKPVTALSEETVQRVFHSFTGTIEQVPPMYSAVKVDGRRLYELAREGKCVKRQARRVTIYRLHFLHMAYGHYPRISFSVECSKGTYIRTLCVDIGSALGYPAHLSRLVRVKSGPFVKEQCVPLEQLEQTPLDEWPANWLFPLETAVRHFPLYTVSPDERKKVVNGQPLDVTDGHFPCRTLIRVYAGEEFLALFRTDELGRTAVPVKVFAEDR